MKRFSIFLITVVLIIGIVGCDTVQYELTIWSNEGGEVTSPSEGNFTYDEGEVVNLVATPDDGYRFVNWTGDVQTIANVNAATTVITIHGDYAIIANFEELPPVNWPLIGGIIAAVVAAGLAIYFVHRRKAAQVKRQGRKKATRKKRR